MNKFKSLIAQQFKLLVLLIIFGCSHLDESNSSKGYNATSVDPEINEQCESSIREIEIFQVLGKNGALASVCDKNSGGCHGMTVAVRSNGDLLWDKKRISAPEAKCFVINSTYSYESKNGATRTVPVVGFTYMYEAQNKEEMLNRMKESLHEMKRECLYDTVENQSFSRSKADKLCNCYSIEMEKEMSSFISQENRDYEDVGEKLQSILEKNCGKYPNKEN